MSANRCTHGTRTRATRSGIGRRIRKIREARGLTLDAVATSCGIAKPNLSRLENDQVTPKFETLRAVAAALDIHPALLVQKTPGLGRDTHSTNGG